MRSKGVSGLSHFQEQLFKNRSTFDKLGQRVDNIRTNSTEFRLNTSQKETFFVAFLNTAIRLLNSVFIIAFALEQKWLHFICKPLFTIFFLTPPVICFWFVNLRTHRKFLVTIFIAIMLFFLSPSFGRSCIFGLAFSIRLFSSLFLKVAFVFLGSHLLSTRASSIFVEWLSDRNKYQPTYFPFHNSSTSYACCCWCARC